LNGEFAPVAFRNRHDACKPRNTKMEIDMLTTTKQALIAITVTLALGMPLSPAFSAPAPSNATMQNQAAPAFRSGELVRLRSGGPLMTVIRIEGDQVNSVWTNGNGEPESDVFPAAVLQMD
jgi:uncharacterized protein YodC (DUF2158 family)